MARHAFLVPHAYPSNPSENGWIAWLGGSAGDSFDTGMDFVGGFNDGFTPTGWITRSATGMLTGYDGVDEDSDAYFYGEVSGTVAGFLVPGAKRVKTYAKAVDGAGDCANWLSKLWRGGCFVAGTPVSVAQLPWNATHQAAIWDDAFVDRAD